MRCALWPHHSVTEHQAEMTAWVTRHDVAVFVCSRESGGLCGFAEVGTRPYVDGGCRTSPVAFLEGWYVDPDRRSAGWPEDEATERSSSCCAPDPVWTRSGSGASRRRGRISLKEKG
jgi:hypothetical protein